ncbi:MAG: inositol monophosphatase family [Candidatus Tokpelaia sp. JSC085]|nr:MAG: inositol monophosphatase family [Candidatus Tokpelaia sp. JSC085]
MSIIIDSDFFLKLARIAARESLPFFRKILAVNSKNETGFDPVTIADIKTEQGLRDYIAKIFPDHGICGEEEGMKRGNSQYLWMIDPIDGTRSFISGIPVWGTLVGLLHNNHAIAGMMTQPFTQEVFYATMKGSFFRHADNSLQILSVSNTVSLADATLFSTTPSLFDRTTGPAFRRLEKAVRLTRFGTDCYAFSMLASGFVDIVVEVEMNPYDVVALIPIIEKAGGIITQWNGDQAEKGGNIIAASTSQLYKAALQKLHDK